MSHFLIIFDRQGRSEPTIETIQDSEQAVARLFELEHKLQGDPETGVVLLFAQDEDTIRATHAHYFKSLAQLLEVAEDAGAPA